MVDLSQYDEADAHLQDCRAALNRLDRVVGMELAQQINIAQELDALLQWVRLSRDEAWDRIGCRMTGKRMEIGGVVYERSKPPVSQTGFERERFLRDLNDATNRKTGEIENPYERLLRVARIDAKNVRITALADYGLKLSDYTTTEWSKLYKVRQVRGAA